MCKNILNLCKIAILYFAGYLLTLPHIKLTLYMLFFLRFVVVVRFAVAVSQNRRTANVACQQMSNQRAIMANILWPVRVTSDVTPARALPNPSYVLHLPSLSLPPPKLF